MTMMFYLTDCPTMELSKKAYSGSVDIYPTVLCMWKLIIWNHTSPYQWCTTQSYIRLTSFSDLHERYLELKQSLQICGVWDDTNLFSAIEYTLPAHTSNLNELLHNELACICEWLTVNRLSLSFMLRRGGGGYTGLNLKKYVIFHPIQNDISSLVIPPATKLSRGGGGVYWINHVRPSAHPSDRPSVRLSVRRRCPDDNLIFFTGFQFDLGWDIEY